MAASEVSREIGSQELGLSTANFLEKTAEDELSFDLAISLYAGSHGKLE